MTFETFLGLATADERAAAVAKHAQVLSATPRLMGSRHISFFSLHALDALANLTLAVAPNFDLPKGLDMLTPLLLPSKGLDILWTLEHTAPFLQLDSPSLHPCIARRVRIRGVSKSLANLTPQWVCSGPAAPPSASPSEIAAFDSFIYMLPDEAVSHHVCAYLACLPPASLDAAASFKDGRQLCELTRGTHRTMLRLNVAGGRVFGRLARPLHGFPSGTPVRMLSTHLQGNAKGACLTFLLNAIERTWRNKTDRLRTTPMALVSAPPPSPLSSPWYALDWEIEAPLDKPHSGSPRAVDQLCVRSAAAELVSNRCPGDTTFVVTTSSSTAATRLPVLHETWAAGAIDAIHTAGSVARIDRTQPRLLLMSDREDNRSGERTTAALRGRKSYWDAQCRAFEGIRLLYEASSQQAPISSFPSSRLAASARLARLERLARLLPSWVVLLDDDSYVNVQHLLHYLRRFDPDRPLLIGHVLNGVWNHPMTPPKAWLPGPGGQRGPDEVRRSQMRPLLSLSGGAGMILSRKALRLMGRALADRTMPLPPRRTPSDVHIVEWAGRLGIRVVHSNLLSYGALPEDARIVHTAGLRVGLNLDDYTARNTMEGLQARAAFALATSRTGVLDPALMGSIVLHRVPPAMMRVLHGRVGARQGAQTA